MGVMTCGSSLLCVFVSVSLSLSFSSLYTHAHSSPPTLSSFPGSPHPTVHTHACRCRLLYLLCLLRLIYLAQDESDSYASDSFDSDG